MYLVSDEYRYILQTWEKSGCTTLRNLFLKLHYDELIDEEKKFVDKNEISSDMPNGPCDSNNFKHIHRDKFPDYLLDVKRDGYFTFGVVRNSYERVVSMYFNRWLNINLVGSYSDKPWDKYRIERDFTFNEFATFLCGGFTEETFIKDTLMPSWADAHVIYDELTDKEKELRSLGKKINPRVHRIRLRNDYHIRRQWSNNAVEIYIHLNKLGTELPKLYEEKIGISARRIRDILSDRKMTLKKGNFKGEGKLDNYDFLMDQRGYDILKNGIPSAKNMITEYNVDLISKWFKEEVQYHRFGFEHLL